MSQNGLSFTEWAVLGLVAEGPTYGFAVGREFAHDGTVGRVWTIPRPLVYRAIDTLVARGLVDEIGSAPGTAGPRRRVIEATPAGEEAVASWLMVPAAHVRDARSELMVKLLLLDRAGKDPLELLQAQAAQLSRLISACREELSRSAGFDTTLLRWRLYSSEGVERFVSELIEERRAPLTGIPAACNLTSHIVTSQGASRDAYTGALGRSKA